MALVYSVLLVIICKALLALARKAALYIICKIIVIGIKSSSDMPADRQTGGRQNRR